MNIFSFGPSKLRRPGCGSGLTASWFQPIICQYTQSALSIKNKFDDLACCNTMMNSSTLKGSSATGLMDNYSRNRESNPDFMICRRYLAEWIWKMNMLWLRRQKKTGMNWFVFTIQAIIFIIHQEVLCRDASKAAFGRFFSFKTHRAQWFPLILLVKIEAKENNDPH